MKTKILILTLVLSAVGGMTHANIPNNYAIYTSASWDSTTGRLDFTTNVTGSTLPPVPPMGGASHYAKVYAAANGQEGGWQQGPNYCTSCQMNWNSSWSFDIPTDCGTTLEDGTCTAGPSVFQVYCTVLGQFLSGSGATTQNEAAITWGELSGGPPKYTQTHYCSNPPPDMPVVTLISNQANAKSAINGGVLLAIHRRTRDVEVHRSALL